MGLGKTITVIALHLHRLEHGAESAGPTLVVCPASLLGNWEAEIERFAPGTPVRRFHGGGRSLAGVEAGFVLTTYGTLRSDHGTDAAGPRLRDVTWGLVVADEAQHVKNAASGAARALRAIPGTARVALTGTPVENNLSELWAILDWAIPGLLGSRNAFRKVWAAPIESGVHEEKTRQFADLVGPVRATAQEVRPRHRAGAAAEDRDRPPARPDPRAGRCSTRRSSATPWSASSGPTRTPGAGWSSRCSPA